jgi:predicted site-specific integrase-resolvase
MTQKKYEVNVRAKRLAEILEVGVSTIWLYAKQGKITPIKLSDRVTVFNLEAVKRALGVNCMAEVALDGK